MSIIVIWLVAMQLEKLAAISFRVIYICSDDSTMLFLWNLKTYVYMYAIGKTTHLCNMRSMHNSERLIND